MRTEWGYKEWAGLPEACEILRNVQEGGNIMNFTHVKQATFGFCYHISQIHQIIDPTNKYYPCTTSLIYSMLIYLSPQCCGISLLSKQKY